MKIQNLKPEACYKMVVTDEASAKKMLKEVVKFLALSFHPDTCAMDYVDVVTHRRTFEKFEAEFLDANMKNAFELLDNVYDRAIAYWHEFGMIDDERFIEMVETEESQPVWAVENQENLLIRVNEIMSKFAHQDDKNCSSVDRDVTTGETVGVRWMEYDGTHHMCDKIQELADELYYFTGRHFCISHNSPTDGHVLIFWEKNMDVKYDPDHFKKTFIAQFEAWQNDPTEPHGSHANAIIFQTLDDTIGRDCECDWRDAIQPNLEMWHQVMMFARNGISL